LFQTLLVHRKFDSDVRQGTVDLLIRFWLDGGIVTRVFMILSDWTEARMGGRGREEATAVARYILDKIQWTRQRRGTDTRVMFEMTDCAKN